jgi:hypothetical protein
VYVDYPHLPLLPRVNQLLHCTRVIDHEVLQRAPGQLIQSQDVPAQRSDVKRVSRMLGHGIASARERYTLYWTTYVLVLLGVLLEVQPVSQGCNLAMRSLDRPLPTLGQLRSVQIQFLSTDIALSTDTCSDTTSVLRNLYLHVLFVLV